MVTDELLAEFDRQAAQLIKITNKELTSQLISLRSQLKNIIQTSSENIPFVLVVKNSIVHPETIMQLVKINGNQGEVRMTPLVPRDFSPISDLNIPEGDVYLLVDVATGRDTLNLTPHNALEKFHQEKRFPLTIDEGAALILQFPEVLTDKKKFNSFSALGSRRDDQRVPAFWISYKKPRLGWCWDNNPHTWLGSASCSSRVGA